MLAVRQQAGVLLKPAALAGLNFCGALHFAHKEYALVAPAAMTLNLMGVPVMYNLLAAAAKTVIPFEGSGVSEDLYFAACAVFCDIVAAGLWPNHHWTGAAYFALILFASGRVSWWRGCLVFTGLVFVLFDWLWLCSVSFGLVNWRKYVALLFSLSQAAINPLNWWLGTRFLQVPRNLHVLVLSWFFTAKEPTREQASVALFASLFFFAYAALRQLND